MIDLRSTTETQEKIRKLLGEREWLNAHIKEVQAQYGEKWIAVSDDKVIAAADSLDRLREEIKGKSAPRETLIIQIPKEIQRPV